jgi:Family of unknown function (DUF6582)
MKRLSDLNVSEVSLVPRGANKKKFLIYKNLEKADLSAQGRKHIAEHNFALPAERKYPIHDIAHARNALARVAQHGSSSEQARVRAAVYRKYPSLKDNAEKVGKSRGATYGSSSSRSATGGQSGNRGSGNIQLSRNGTRMEKSIMKADNEIMNLINAVDPETMKRVDKVLKSMTKMKKFKGEEGEDKAACKSGDGDMLPRKDSAAYKMRKMKMKKDDDGDMGDVSMGDHQEMGEGEDDAPLSERAQAAVKAISRIAAPFKDELSHDHIKAALKEVGFHPGAEDMEQDEKDPHDEKVHMNWAIPEGVEEEHHSDALDMARKTYKSHLEKMGYRKYPDPSLDETNAMEKSKHGMEDDDDDDEEDEEVGKIAKSDFNLSSFPKAQQAQLENIFKSHTELVRKNADLEKELKVERDIRRMKEFENRAREFKHLGVNSTELASVMKSLSESDTKSFEKVERILKAADNQLAQGGGLYGELGSRMSNAEGSAEAKLEALVDSVVHKSDGSKTKEMIADEVYKTKEGKRLLQEVMNEQHDRIRRMGAAS